MKRLFIFKITVFAVIFVMLSCSTILAAASEPKIHAGSAILIESRRGQMLYERLSHKRLHVSMASKIMTALVVIEKAKLDSKVTISKESTSAEGSSPNLEIGEKYAVEDLLFAVMLSSANDATNALAEFVGGDTAKFVALMNNKASELNLKDTHFSNPSGVYDQTQYTTASDLAALIRYAVTNPAFDNFFSYKAKPWMSSNGSHILVNSNKLFWGYEGIDGGKAETADKSNQAAVTTATRDNTRLICVVLDSPKDTVFNDTSYLLDYGFMNYKSGILVNKGEIIKNITVENEEINLVSLSDVYYSYPLGENYIKNIEVNVSKDLKLPITKDKIIGTARYVLKDDTSIDIGLYSDREVHPPTKLFDYFMEKLTENRDIYYLVIILLFIEALVVLFHLFRLFRKKSMQ